MQVRKAAINEPIEAKRINKIKNSGLLKILKYVVYSRYLFIVAIYMYNTRTVKTLVLVFLLLPGTEFDGKTTLRSI